MRERKKTDVFQIRRKRTSVPIRTNQASSPFISTPTPGADLISPPATAELEDVDVQLGLIGNQGVEESMRVEYIDPAGAKERKRLWAAFQPSPPEKKARTAR